MQLVATSFEAKPQPRSFVPKMNNDVLASLEMMLTFGQMMLCLTAQMKKSKPIGLDFLAAEEGFEPSQTESESVALPLGDTAKLIFDFVRNTLYQNKVLLSILFPKKTVLFLKKLFKIAGERDRGV